MHSGQEDCTATCGGGTATGASAAQARGAAVMQSVLSRWLHRQLDMALSTWAEQVRQQQNAIALERGGAP